MASLSCYNIYFVQHPDNFETLWNWYSTEWHIDHTSIRLSKPSGGLKICAMCTCLCICICVFVYLHLIVVSTDFDHTSIRLSKASGELQMCAMCPCLCTCICVFVYLYLIVVSTDFDHTSIRLSKASGGLQICAMCIKTASPAFIEMSSLTHSVFLGGTNGAYSSSFICFPNMKNMNCAFISSSFIFDSFKSYYLLAWVQKKWQKGRCDIWKF